MTTMSKRLRDEYEEDPYWSDGYLDWREVSDRNYTYSSNSRMSTDYSRDGTKFKRSVNR